jgi:CCR4-NOT transcription complex subunit 1
MRVYEDFMRVARSSSPREAERLRVQSQQQQQQQRQDVPRDTYGAPTSAEPSYEAMPAVLTTPQALEKFSNLMIELERSIAQNPTVNLASLQPNHVIRAFIRQVPLLVTQSSNRDDCALLFSQKIVQELLKTESKLGREVHLLILERLCEISKRFFKELKEWLLYDNDEVSSYI